jgi:hypothetical protein
MVHGIYVVHICLYPTCRTDLEEAKDKTLDMLLSNYAAVKTNSIIRPACPWSVENVESIFVCESNVVYQDLCQARLILHVYKLNDRLEYDELSTSTVLPARSLQGQWESLVFEDELKNLLLDYVYTSMLFSDMDIDPNVISVNRVILLQGPPGTGKTSLCRGLAQTLSIRLSARYGHMEIVEINANNLFSKYFAESGKLVTRLFEQISQRLDDKNSFVCLLMGILR